ncbi:selection and upkeep of intraepithelial T-cells protein 10-like [Rattus norvegicus]|uniref:selection and upkeep of intraepithelial T-cells protein 10-like n=1 Tax=Rattus norvegicus TaxID=10116 RepID=UPI0019179215|nr:selection and upkeep of intraepithelial T-cells protein 10-like [Rattus norvegicus]
MEPSASCLPGFFMVFLLLQITVLTQAMSVDMQVTIQFPDTGGVLVECTSGSLTPPVEMTWKDSEGNITSHSTTYDFEDRAGLLYLKSRILLKNRVQGPISCSIYNVTTNQEKKRSIVLPDVLFKSEYMSLMSNKFLCPLTYLSTIVFIIILRGMLIFCLIMGKPVYLIELMIKIQKVLNNKMKVCCTLIWESFLLILYIGFLPLYLKFRSRASILDDAYSLYSYWLQKICIILILVMIFFIGIILFLLWTLNRYDQISCLPSLDHSTHNSEENSSEYVELQEINDVILRRGNI